MKFFWTLIIALFLFLPLVFGEFALAERIKIPFEGSDVENLPFTSATEQSIVAGAGSAQLGLLVARVTGFLKFFLGAIVILIFLISGYRLVMAGSSISDEITKQKSVLLYAIVGLIVVVVSQDVAQYFLGGTTGKGEFILDEQASILQATLISRRLVEIVNYFLSFVGAGAILMLVITGTQLVLNPGDEGEIGKKMKTIGFVATGIVMIAMSEVLINRVVFPDGGYRGVDIDAGVEQLVGLSNYVLGFMGVIILVTLVLGGFALLFYAANEEVVGKVKSVMGHVILGALVSYSAYTIVATIVNLSYR